MTFLYFTSLLRKNYANSKHSYPDLLLARPTSLVVDIYTFQGCCKKNDPKKTHQVFLKSPLKKKP